MLIWIFHTGLIRKNRFLEILINPITKKFGHISKFYQTNLTHSQETTISAVISLVIDKMHYQQVSCLQRNMIFN